MVKSVYLPRSPSGRSLPPLTSKQSSNEQRKLDGSSSEAIVSEKE